jgi:hypothetical protein
MLLQGEADGCTHSLRCITIGYCTQLPLKQ